MDEVGETIRSIAMKHGKDLMRLPNVVGYSLEPHNRIRRGSVIHGPRVLRVYVSKKFPETQLRKDEMIPREIEGVETDVIEIGTIKKLEGFREKIRPAPAGVSTSRADENAAGTIGWFMVDEDGQLYMLSNNHVWAKENLGSRGDPLVQPGILDGGDPSRDVIASLYDFVPIDFTGLPNTVDAAIALPADMTQIYTSIMVLGGIAGKTDPALNTKVYKVGRTTGLASGTITDTSAVINVQYDSGVATFNDVFIASGAPGSSDNGDSGSPIVDENLRFLGLLFAGNDSGSIFVGCKASNIESALRTRIVKKIWVLPANTYPPFKKEVVKALPGGIEMTTQLLVLMAVLGVILRGIRGIR